MDDKIKKLTDSIDNSGKSITFGLQYWHIKRIEEERERWNKIDIGNENSVDIIYASHFWEDLGKEFAWQPLTLALYYFLYLNDCEEIGNKYLDY